MTIGRYQTLKKLGGGGMGEVWLAEDTVLRRKVALKFLAPSLAGETNFKIRFLREAQAAAGLQHPNIIAIYDFGEAQNRFYIVMEYVKGESLRDLIDREDLAIGKALDLAIQICAGLSAAHAAGIVHRDMKPANIMLDKDGRVKIADFGLARVEGVAQLTDAGAVMGTPHYMSPEQAQGRKLDQRSDIFSVGVILYELLTRRQPFSGEDTRALFEAIKSRQPEPLARYKAEVSPELQRIVDKALDKDVAARYQNVSDLSVDLGKQKKALSTTPLPSAPPPVPPIVTVPPQKTAVKRNYRLIASVAVSALFLLVFLARWLNLSLLERKVNQALQTENLPQEGYAGYKAAGDSLFDRRQYAEAKMKYEQALAHNSNDQNVIRQIEECKRLIAIIQEAERHGMVYIPGGAFLMGSEDGEDDEKPVHQVYVNEFCIDKYEVTVEQYRQFLLAKERRQPEKWDEQAQFPQRPVVYVNWDDANAYASWAGKRLPTEAEWEYAARGGNTGLWGKPKYKFVWGDDASSIPANYNADGSRSREWKSAKRYLREGGTYAPNGYGLYDMAGNVWEWCADWYAENYYQDSLERNPKGPGTGTQGVLRGGAWNSDLDDLRCANRLRYFASNADDIVGFRCAKDIR